MKTAVLFLVASFSLALGLKNGLDLVPSMGWNTWEHLGCGMTENDVKDAAHALVSKGLVKAGYTMLSLDDCWMDTKRNATGFLQPTANFSSGMKSMGQFIHSLGMKYGIYESAGTMSCQQRMGSLGYEWIDAQTFAEWEVDYLKYDDCFHELYAQVEQDAPHRFPFDGPPILRYPLMGQALNKTGRNISYMCNFPWQFWGQDADASMGGDWTGEFCNSWRTCGDPSPGFQEGLGYVDCAEQWADDVHSGPGRWNNLDAIEIGNGDLTQAQEQVLFSLYAVIKTPLFIGADPRTLSGDSLSTYLNNEVIALNQDPLGQPGRKRQDPSGKNGEVWTVKLEKGDAAAVMVNRAQTAANVTVFWKDLGFADDKAKLSVRDLWAHEDLGATQKGFFLLELAAESGATLRFSPAQQ